MKMYLNSSTDFSITDHRGKKYTVKEAKEIYELFYLDDTNIAFRRLVYCNWNMKRVKEFYKHM